MNNKFKLIKTIKVSNILGESVIWDERDNSIWWTDIMNRKLFHYYYDCEKLVTFEVFERACGIALTTDISTLIVAFETGIALYNWQDSNSTDENQIEWIFRPYSLGEGIRFNDARADNQGRFWASTMIEDDSIKLNQAQLVSVEHDKTVRPHLSNFKVGNCLAWSSNSNKMYFADSSSQTIRHFEFDAIKGTLHNSSIFLKTLINEFPDGGEVDTDNNLWFANWGGSNVSICDHTGCITNKLKLPVTQPTCVTFGGAKKDLLIVTSATYNKTDAELAAEPNAGNLFIYQTNFKGQRSNKWGTKFNGQ